MISAEGVQMKKKQIKVIKNLPGPKLVRDIKVFIRFATFYY